MDPVGDTGNWGEKHYPYRLLAHRVRVVEETDAWQALGRHGREVLGGIEQQIPERAAQWAADWTADPEGMRERRETWRLCTSDCCTSGLRARSLITDAARARRETAALDWGGLLASAAAEKALADTGIGQATISYACDRASDLVHAVQLQDRWSAYVLDTLRGTDLDDHPINAPA